MRIFVCERAPDQIGGGKNFRLTMGDAARLREVPYLTCYRRTGVTPVQFNPFS